jgi:hypothetical protein
MLARALHISCFDGDNTYCSNINVTGGQHADVKLALQLMSALGTVTLTLPGMLACCNPHQEAINHTIHYFNVILCSTRIDSAVNIVLSRKAVAGQPMGLYC